jgi:hypothetical protein
MSLQVSDRWHEILSGEPDSRPDETGLMGEWRAVFRHGSGGAFKLIEGAQRGSPLRQ